MSSADTPEPQFLGTTYSSLCSLLDRPMLLTGLFREVLIWHFGSDQYIEFPELKQLIWQDNYQTNILIETIHRWRPELTAKRPAVIIKRNAFSNQRIGIGDRHQGPPADRLGHPHYATFWLGSHTLFCIGGTGAQAELLASEVRRELTQFGPLIQQTASLHRFQVVEVGAIKELEESTENFVVPVTVGYAFEDRWVIVKQAPILKTLSLSLMLEC